MEFSISYSIENKYENPVTKSFFQILAIPAVYVNQNISELDIKCSLKSTEYFAKNSFGFNVLQYTRQEPIDAFSFHLDVKVKVKHQNPFNFIPWPPQEELQRLSSDAFKLEHFLFLRPTPLTDIPKEVAEGFISFKNEMGVLNFLRELNQKVNGAMQYTVDVTTTKTAALEAFCLEKGVCQDYTHIFISIARQFGIPCRYVSGYMNPGFSHIGTSQTHAWAEAFIPHVGWIGFDPTNNLLVNHHYIKIAHGTDYNDCSPIKGIIQTVGEQKHTHKVTVINQ
ncbi:transglutaminase-like domain-containing protein [Saccharicrinis sp. GN24d3]|uniref:transglutaminase-like domain-containing protein n=1 Tax=Saccharicrinis sp. GN24d3 TaxID=3458416 RepID=UPI004036D02B